MHTAQIMHLAFTDPLTGLPNRRYLYEMGASLLATATSERKNVALLYLDLDRFKAFNDSLGHDAGDELLMQVARRLGSTFGEGTLLARIGGDEFAALLYPADTGRALAFAEAMLRRLQQPFEVREQQVHLAGSIGIALGPLDGLPFSVLLTHADIAMYRAKRNGSSIEVHNPLLSPMLRDQLQLEVELRQALATDGLTLYYQPILHVRSQAITWFEALVRWPHPTRGLLLPSVFLPLAEEVGLLGALDRWVLQTALQQAAAWAAVGYPCDMAVNLTAQSLQNPALVSDIATLLARTGARASRIIIEITEHTALSDLAATRQVLAGLKGLGMRIALDDFGSGYASLTHLRQLPVDVLKLDRAFATGIGRERKDEAVVRALLALGWGLGLTTLVEGVENMKQLHWLRAQGCLFVQGYLIGRPVPPEQIAEGEGM